MKLNACFLIVLLGIGLAQAGPAPKNIEKKSLAEDSEAETVKEDLQIDEADDDKDRSKKAALCLQIEPENRYTVPLTMQAQAIPQQLQTLSMIQPQASIMVPQQIVQPIPQPLSQANIVLPQQVVQPIHTVRIVQPASPPCAQSAPIQSPPEVTPKPDPKPAPTPDAEPIPVTERPEPMRIVERPLYQLPEPQESLAVMPIVPAYHEHLMMIPEPEPSMYVQVPAVSSCTNPLHGLVNECTCQKVEPMAMMPVPSYSFTYAKSPVMMPQAHTKVGPHGRTKTYVNVNAALPYHTVGHQHIHPHTHKQTIHQNMYVQEMDSGMVNPYPARQLVDSSYEGAGVTINAFPHTFKGAHPVQHATYPLPAGSLRNKENILRKPMSPETHSLMSSNKMPRETDSNQLSPEAMTESKQEEGKAMLIDGRRNARSNKEEAKVAKKQLTTKT